MKIKKLFITCMIALFTMTSGLSADGETSGAISKRASERPVSANTRELVDRLEEIKAMDIKSMSKAEKKALRKEVKAIKKKLNHVSDGGLYISFGGLIIVLLLLILLV